MQVAAIGLLGAIDRFDPDRGGQFRSFAVPTILGELKRHFRNTGWAVHVPRGAQELAQTVERARRELTDRNGRAASPAQIAEFLEMNLADVVRGMATGTAHFSQSMDAPTAGARRGCHVRATRDDRRPRRRVCAGGREAVAGGGHSPTAVG